VFVACWSVKGGSGTTVVAASLALVLARRAQGALLVDLRGDAPAVLGVPEPTGPGLSDWLSAGEQVPADGLARIEVPVVAGLSLVPLGSGSLGHPERADVLAAMLASERRAAVVDCGRLDLEVSRVLAASATHSLLVTRACYLALRRAVAAPLRPSAVIVVEEPGRALSCADVAEVLGVPVAAQVLHDPAVARAVDAGLLASRLPRGLERALRQAA
jgi:Mrp family chromosome partitioning ATPase